VAAVERLKVPDAYEIAADAIAAVRAHANRERRPDFEVGGELVVHEGRIVSYEPLPNLAAEAGWYEPVRLPQPPRLLLHSHPGRWEGLSKGDLAFMRAYGIDSLAVFSPDYGRLTVWVLDESRESGVRAVPVRIERRPSRRLPPRRPGRRW